MTDIHERCNAVETDDSYSEWRCNHTLPCPRHSRHTEVHVEVNTSVEVQEMKGLTLHEPPYWDMLTAQKTLQQALIDAGKASVGVEPAETYAELLERTRFNLEALNVEAVELLDHLPWKSWKTYKVSLDEALDRGTITEMKFELVDMLHFIVNIAIALGMDWAEIESIFYTKHLENLRRAQEGY